MLLPTKLGPLKLGSGIVEARNFYRPHALFLAQPMVSMHQMVRLTTLKYKKDLVCLPLAAVDLCDWSGNATC